MLDRRGESGSEQAKESEDKEAWRGPEGSEVPEDEPTYREVRGKEGGMKCILGSHLGWRDATFLTHYQTRADWYNLWGSWEEARPRMKSMDVEWNLCSSEWR